jgi:chromosome segregation ATPase
MSDDPTARVLAAIAQLGGEVSQLRGGMVELRSDMAELRSDMAELRSDMAELRSDMAELRSDMIDRTDGLRADLTELRTDLTQLRTDMIDRTDGLRADMGRFRSDMMGRMDRLQISFSGMQQDITVNFAASDRAERIARNATDAARDDIRAVADQMSAMERQIRLLGARVTHLEIGDNGLARQG